MACTRTPNDVVGQPRPMLRRPRVMLDVVTIVEKRHIVENSVSALRSSSVLEVSVNVAKHQSRGIPRQINAQEKLRRMRKQERPHREHENRFRRNYRRNLDSICQTRMVCEMPLSP